jgi:hypothetical protein
VTARQKESAVSYHLFRVAEPDAAVIDGIHLGEFPDFDTALEARDDDVIAVLAATGHGEHVLVCHRVVGPDAFGSEQEYPVISELEGPAASADRQRALAETRRWLSQIHGGTFT